MLGRGLEEGGDLRVQYSFIENRELGGCDDSSGGSTLCAKRKAGEGDSPWVGRGPCGRRQTVNIEEIYSLLCCCSSRRFRHIYHINQEDIND